MMLHIAVTNCHRNTIVVSSNIESNTKRYKRVQKRLKSPIKGEVVNLSNFERVLLKLLLSGFELHIGISNIAHSNIQISLRYFFLMI